MTRKSDTIKLLKYLLEQYETNEQLADIRLGQLLLNAAPKQEKKEDELYGLITDGNSLFYIEPDHMISELSQFINQLEDPDINKYKLLSTNNIVYHVDSYQSLKDLAKKLENIDCRLGNGMLPTAITSLRHAWNDHTYNTAIHVKNRILTHANLNFFKEFYPELPIVKWKSFE